MALRGALGGSRRCVIRQLVTETTLVSLLGGTLGFLLAFCSVRAVNLLAAAVVPRAQELGVDLRALGFALLASAATGLVTGLLPALQVSSLALNDALKEGARGSAVG